MTDRNPYWPTAPRPYVSYHPPFGAEQPARWSGLREVWSGTRHFCEQIVAPIGKPAVMQVTVHRWSPERLAERAHMDWVGPWPASVTRADFDEAVEVAGRRLGKPKYSSSSRRRIDPVFDEEHTWLVPITRSDEVLDYVEQMKHCTVGKPFAPVQVSYSCVFRLRDPKTGKAFRGLTWKHYPMMSQVSVHFAQECTSTLMLVMPFAEPDESAAEYVMALQEHAPVWMDPRYFDHMVPEPAEAERLYRRRRLPPEWIGRTSTGELRLDQSKSGLTPALLDLPTDEDLATEDRAARDAAYREKFYALERALRDHHAAAVLVRGPFGSSVRHIVTQVATTLGMPAHVVEVARKPGTTSPSVAEELRTLVWTLEDRPAVLIIELSHEPDDPANAAILTQMSTRTVDRAALPSDVRLVVIAHSDGSEATQKAMWLVETARQEGFATREQLDYLSRRHSHSAFRDVEVVPIARG